ncbi:hypothetical protein LPJ53_001478 [Coemansia erecta]|uniref:HOOK N-terminal domain-containing protein n=1 Tax=Coemansia erecta TaxID=147472 RepID=A0A9W7Y3Z4_9FUNG|nr:hypothetical protein LPJ53_001478 [Coemansia erecta]
MSQEDIANGFVHWVGTFNALSKPVAQLSDLTDGIALFEICAEIDKQWFKSIRSADIGDNWVLKMNNLKKLYKLVTQYYEEVLGYPASNLAEPNLSAIAKNEDPEELLKLCHLILTLAVQCERNQVYISKIMSLVETDQRSLMVSIESVLTQLGSGDPDGDTDSQDVDMMDVHHRGADTGSDDPVTRLQAELIRSYAEKDELERSAHDLSIEHQAVQSKYEELLLLNEELKTRMDDLEKSMARADKSGRSDFLLRTEIENLKHDLAKADMRCQDAERVNREQAAGLSDMTRRLADAAEAQDEVVRLRDQLQEHRHAAERLAKSEHVIEKYKKKLEESTDLRRQVRALEEQLAVAHDRARQAEEEYRRIAQRRPAADNVRDEYAQLEARHATAATELTQALDRLRTSEQERDRLRSDAQRDQELIASLEESLREMEFTGGAAGHGSAAATLESGIASADAADERAALLLKVARLERELSEARRSADASAPSTTAADFLEEVADAAVREKDAALAELAQERSRRQELEASLATRDSETVAADAARAKEELRHVTEQLMASSSEVAAVRSELAQTKDDLERARASALATEQERNAAREALRRMDPGEAASLRAENKSLEEWYAETHEQSKQFKDEIDRLSSENRLLTQKMSQMQEVLTHAEIRNREHESAMRYSPADVEMLQKELIKSRDEVHSLQIGLKRTKDHCLMIDRKLKETQQTAALAGPTAQSDAMPENNYREALLALQSQVALKDEQLNSMRDMLREQNNVHLLESRTMASAWFNLQRQLERQSGFGHSSGMGSAAASSRQGSTPASWLGQQRVTLDMQLTG